MKREAYQSNLIASIRPAATDSTMVPTNAKSEKTVSIHWIDILSEAEIQGLSVVKDAKYE